MKKILAPMLAVILFCSCVYAAPLNDFHNNTLQIDIGFSPSVKQFANSDLGQLTLPNVSDYSGNITLAFNDFIALRAGLTSLSTSQVDWNNTNTGVLGLTQANLQVVINPSEYIQPFIGVQYAVNSFQDQTGGGWKNLDSKQTGVCGGVQLTLPLADLFKLNASGMYGTYFSSLYGGVSLSLLGKIDVDAGYVYEDYNIGQINNLALGTITAQGPRLGLSFRI